jgi:hypothetical protein
VLSDVFGRRFGTIGFELWVNTTGVKELCAVERLWKTSRDSELFVVRRQEEDQELWFVARRQEDD